MKVVLCEDVEKLGKEGDTVNVKDGFARNFLFPRGLAMGATEANIRQLQHKKQMSLAREKREKQRAIELSEQLDKMSITIKVKIGEKEQMYGAVTNADIEKALMNEGIKIDKKDILLEDPIKELGVYSVQLRLFSQLQGKIKVWVVKE